MKKLNRKGFTLIELLAVVVILAIILVVTIPSVLDTMTTARKKSFEDAVDIIRDYAQKQYDICKVSSGISGVTYETTLFTTGTCNFDSSKYGTLVTKAGYKTTDISISSVAMDTTNTNRVTVKAGPPKDASNNYTGTFKDYGSTQYTAS